MNEAGPVRMCAICRTRLPKANLLRHVRDSNGILILDEKQTRPGRGWYVCDNEKCREKFAKFRPGKSKAGRKSRQARH